MGLEIIEDDITPCILEEIKAVSSIVRKIVL